MKGNELDNSTTEVETKCSRLFIQMDKVPSAYNRVKMILRTKVKWFLLQGKVYELKTNKYEPVEKDWGISEKINIRNIVNLVVNIKLWISRGVPLKITNPTTKQTKKRNPYEDIIVEW